jgi:ABC-2 type transport system ATP-binding protein
MTGLLEVTDIVKRFGPITAVDGISFSVARGEVLGFLGPNGAGKSTTMKVATGFLHADEGRVTICGADMDADPLTAKARLGYLAEGAPAYGDMTPLAFLAFIARARRLADAENAIERAAAAVSIRHVMHQPIGTLSKGYKRRVGLAQAILHDPEVLILDEPTDGLDPNQKHEVRELIHRMAAEKAIVISTHILEEVQAVCTRAIIIDRGRIVLDGTPGELIARSRYHNAVSLKVAKADLERIQRDLAALSHVSGVEARMVAADIAHIVAFTEGGETLLPHIGGLAKEAGWQVHEIYSESGRMDDVFRAITTGENMPDTPDDPTEAD